MSQKAVKEREDAEAVEAMREARKAWAERESPLVKFWRNPEPEVWAGGVVPLTTSGQVGGLTFTTTSGSAPSSSFMASALRG